jgi:hypothetical protein
VSKDEYLSHVAISDQVKEDNVFLTKESWDKVEDNALFDTKTVKNAADTQALLHLYQNYCQHHECINCEVCYKIFQDNQLKLF